MCCCVRVRLKTVVLLLHLRRAAPIRADAEGIIVGRTNLPIVNRGDALFHVARMKKSDMVQTPLFDEDEII